MNPETGKLKRVMGSTSDGINVYESHGLRLRFTPICFSNEGHGSGIFADIEWQKNEIGKRRPHLIFGIGSLIIQSGWLFG